jgi:hypothetical protein
MCQIIEASAAGGRRREELRQAWHPDVSEIFGKETQHMAAVFLEQRVLAAVTAVGGGIG